MAAQLLGQQQAFDPGPTRRIIVAPGHGGWWGVDPSTLRVSIAAVSRRSDGQLDRSVRTQPFAAGEGAARLSEIYQQTVTFTRWAAISFGGPFPGLVVVEQPSGKRENPALSYAVGVIQAAVFDGLRAATGRAVAMEMVTSSHWKLVACGKGNIFKPKRGGEEYGVLTWARANGYEGLSWDEADALGIAECARREVALEER